MKNISRIISIVFLSSSILLLCYVFYRSHFFYSGLRFDYYSKAYVIVFLFIILSFISFFIPKKLKINITTVFISILIGLYLVEGYLFIKNKDNRFVIYKNNTGKDYDKRTLLEIYQDLKKEDPNIVHLINPTNLLDDNNLNYFSLSGIPNRKTIFCNENGYFSIYQSDRYGFNNPDEEWDKEKIKFLLVGDSFAHGACVNEPDTISGNLRKFNNNTKGILNLAMNGNGPLIEYATLREYLPTVKVERVLWMFFDNDLENLKIELRNKILVNYLNNKKFTQNLILKKQEIKKILLKELEREMLIYERQEKIKERLQKFKILIRFVRLDLTRLFIRFSKNLIVSINASTKEFENILKLSNEFTKQNKSKLYFVYLPEYERFIGWNTHISSFNYKKITKIVKNLDIPIIDINKELFRKHDDPLSLFPFRKYRHYNEKGYQLVAETIFRKINELEK